MNKDIAWAIVKVAIILLSIVATLFYIISVNDQEWQEFATKHHCEVIGKTSETYIPAVNYNNVSTQVTTIYISGKVDYKYDDGIEYWR
jgi:hypothetical protein